MEFRSPRVPAKSISCTVNESSRPSFIDHRGPKIYNLMPLSVKKTHSIRLGSVYLQVQKNAIIFFFHFSNKKLYLFKKKKLFMSLH